MPSCKSRMGRRILLPLCLVFLAALLAACSGTPAPADKVFAVEDLRITLTDAFTEVYREGYAMCYAADRANVVTLKEEFSLAEGLEEMTTEEYARELIVGTGRDPDATPVLRDGERIHYDYKETVGDETYFYMTYLYKTDEAFWVVQFAAALQDEEEYRPLFARWASGVSFA